ncbi:hypothetical protein PBY51_023496 [Eleginops maclovinus]|uniref:Uncharacterized protein n=2 Tax=Eleginops maclovinus TaxID=56733 RepID=A0AAN7X2D2_ELEMC|nr:hypothetical protein PBY51_023496 [Eleginops maclovinus]
MLIYTVFTVVNKARMMLTGSSVSPFAAIESTIYKTLFSGHSYAALTDEVEKTCMDKGAINGTTSTKKSSEKGAEKHTPVSPVKGQSGSLKAKDESENTQTKNSKKKN